MKQTLISCISAALVCIAFNIVSYVNSYKEDVSEKCIEYDKLVNDQLHNINLQTARHIVQPTFNSWHTNNEYHLKDFEIGYIKRMPFKHVDNFIPSERQNEIIVKNDSYIVIPNPKFFNDEYDGMYIEFIYRGMRYVIALVKYACKYLVYGMSGSINDSKSMHCITRFNIARRSTFWRSDYMLISTYINKWWLNNSKSEYMTVCRDDDNNVVLKFMVY